MSVSCRLLIIALASCPMINITWAPTPPTHSGEEILRLECLIVEGWTFVKHGPTQEALVSHQNALVGEELRQHSRHLLDNVPDPWQKGVTSMVQITLSSS